MQKNEIINKIIEKLLEHRSNLTYEFKEINFNENNYIEKKMALETAIMNLDYQIQNHLMNCTL